MNVAARDCGAFRVDIGATAATEDVTAEPGAFAAAEDGLAGADALGAAPAPDAGRSDAGDVFGAALADGDGVGAGVGDGVISRMTGALPNTRPLLVAVSVRQ